MFGIGTPELLVIIVVALIVLGPDRLPEVARAVGKALSELRRVTGGLTEELQNARIVLEEEVGGATRKREEAKPPDKPPGAPAVEPEHTVDPEAEKKSHGQPES
jgi:Tat protein translocase TatB subunit